MVEVTEGEVLAWEPQSGYADPYLVTTSYAARARELGAEIMLRSPALGIEVVGGRVRAVMTPEGRVETEAVVVAAGPWSGKELAKIGYHIRVLDKQSKDTANIHPRSIQVDEQK